MRAEMAEFVEGLRCPDDTASLRVDGESLSCPQCGRNYPRIGDRSFEILPSTAAKLPAETLNNRYAADYHRLFHASADSNKDAVAWGAPEVVSERWDLRRRRHVREVLAFLRMDEPSGKRTFCDFSAGAGHCTFEAARAYKTVFHSDLSADSLSYASKRAAALGLNNIVFIRSDYFAPPFRASVDHIVCLDTLIRGEWHEQRLLTSLRRALSPAGAAVVDFHNWWHNPLRRAGLLPQNFAENRSYAAAELPALLTEAGVSAFDIRPFFQELSTDRWPSRLLKRMIPPTRFLLRFSSPEPKFRLEPLRESITARG
jgi:SAM-dependent methyltransferase